MGLLTGCMFEEESIETEDDNLVHMVFTAMVEDGNPATRTVLDENEVDGIRGVLWEPEDVIGIATYNGRYQRFENVLEEPAASGVFEGSVNQDIMYYAIYPYRDNQQMSSSVNVTIPSKQTYKPNSFDGSAAPMVGKGNHAEPLHFMNLCGSLAINITGTITVIMVGLFVVLLSEGYLADIALVYSMLSFLAVIVLSKVYTGIYYERKHEEELLAAEARGEEEAK